MSERSKVIDSKSIVQRKTAPGVRIPLSPPPTNPRKSRTYAGFLMPFYGARVFVVFTFVRQFQKLFHFCRCFIQINKY